MRTGLRPLPTWEILPGANEKPERPSAPGGSCLGPREGCVRRDDVSRPSTAREMRVARAPAKQETGSWVASWAAHAQAGRGRVDETRGGMT